MSTYTTGPCLMCKQDNARPYCMMNENWRGCNKYTAHLIGELEQAKQVISELVEGAELIFDDLNLLRTSRICDARDKAKKLLKQ